MDNLEQKIQEYFKQKEIKGNFDILVQRYFKDENQKKGFLDVFELIKKGEFNIDDLYDYLNEWYGVEIEKTLKFDNELFDKVYGDVYNELQELYGEKQKKKVVEGLGEVGKTSAQSVNEPIDLAQRYQRFAQSSLFQNILASQERMKEKYGGWLQSRVLGTDWSRRVASSQDDSSQRLEPTIKDDFYTAINAGDKIKVAGILRMVCEQGKLREFFKKDERYVDFFSGVLERHQGGNVKEQFLKDPGNKKYLIEFLKFILEKRVGFSNDESAMLGAGLGSLCREAGENEYEEIAYGDEGKGSFVWSI